VVGESPTSLCDYGPRRPAVPANGLRSFRPHAAGPGGHCSRWPASAGPFWTAKGAPTTYNRTRQPGADAGSPKKPEPGYPTRPTWAWVST